MNYGKAFKEIREEQNLSRAEVAKQIGCTASALSKIERGKVVPKHVTIETFCIMMLISTAVSESFNTVLSNKIGTCGVTGKMHAVLCHWHNLRSLDNIKNCTTIIGET